MDSQPQNPEFRNNSENFHPNIYHNGQISQVDSQVQIGLAVRTKLVFFSRLILLLVTMLASTTCNM